MEMVSYNSEFKAHPVQGNWTPTGGLFASGTASYSLGMFNLAGVFSAHNYVLKIETFFRNFVKLRPHYLSLHPRGLWSYQL
jgi:hypothetical protein